MPGIGDLTAVVIATNNVTVPALHGLDCLALGVLPWGDDPVGNVELVPNTINEISFDFPAISLPSTIEIMRAGMSKEDREAGDFNYLSVAPYHRSPNRQ